jgi:hypothetical protein
LNILTNKILVSFREHFKIIFRPKLGLQKSTSLVDIKEQEVSDFIITKIKSGEPFLVSRFGSEELRWYRNYKLLSKNFFQRSFNFITFRVDHWKKENRIIDNLTFRPADLLSTKFFIEKMDQTIPQIDLLGSWLKIEQSKCVKFNSNIRFAFLLDLDPFFHSNPWTLALQDKKVLIIHPMIDEILDQFEKREKLFKRPLLPDFDLLTITAPYFDNPEFPTWISIYKYYLKEIARIDDFDIAIVGCGPWGMPISGEIKKRGKQVIHLGGSLQLLFGIIGQRWLDSGYENSGYPKLPNEHWIAPYSKPSWANNYDSSSYWK